MSGPFTTMARELRRDGGRVVIDINDKRKGQAEGKADRFIAAALQRDGGFSELSRLSLITSNELRRVAITALASEPWRKAVLRLCAILNTLTAYTEREAVEIVSLRAIARATGRAAELIEEAATELHQAEGLDRPIRSPGGRWQIDLFNPERLPDLARNGGLVFALKALAHSMRSGTFHNETSIPGVSPRLLAKRGPGLHADPGKAVAGFMSANIIKTLPNGLPDPFIIVAGLLQHIGVDTTPQKVRASAQARGIIYPK